LKLMKEDLLQISEKLTFNQPLGFIPWRKMRSKLYWTFFPNNPWSQSIKYAQPKWHRNFSLRAFILFIIVNVCIPALTFTWSLTCWIQMLRSSSFTCFAPRWTHYLCIYLSDTFKSSFGFSFMTVNSLFCFHVRSYDKFKSCFGSFNSKFAWH
jgi:hypothetical protein